jgi:AraC-like DNA-binding protein
MNVGRVRRAGLSERKVFVHEPQVSEVIRRMSDRAKGGGREEVPRPVGLRAGFHADVKDSEGSGLSHAGEQWAPASFLIPRHTHQVWEFYLQVHGSSQWFAEGQVHVLRPGTLLAVAPGVIHHMAARTTSNTHFYFAGLALDRVLERHPELRGMFRRAPRVIRRSGSLPLTQAFDQLVHEVTAAWEFGPAGLVLAVDRLVLETGRLLVPRQPPGRVAMHPSVRRAKALFDRDFARRWTLRELSAEVDLAPAYLAGLFTADVGMPPHRYLLERRVERAKRLLASTDLPMTAIGIEVGFGSGQHFARVFRQTSGNTPSEYRRGARAGA